MVAIQYLSRETASLTRARSRSLPAYACSRRSVCSTILGTGSFLFGARSGFAANKTQPEAKSVIVLLLEGGISQFESWDPKPDAPSEIRGSFGAIPTTNPDLRLGEYLPRTARQAHLFSVIRTMQNLGDASHDHSLHRLLTGYEHPTVQPGADVLRNFYPTQGSIVAHEGRKAANRGLPAFVTIPDLVLLGNTRRLLGPTYLGPSCAAFQSGAVPTRASGAYAVPDGLAPAKGMTVRRVSDRRRLLQTMDELMRTSDYLGPNLSAYEQSAFDLLLGDSARKAFDLNAESVQTRERYGDSAMGQGTLLARRLAEAGVPYTLVNCGEGNNLFDTHSDNFNQMKNRLLPSLDRAASALLQDLDQRGLLESTLVVFLTEFGRSPQINKDAGREHWTQAYSVVLAGGGIQPARLIGRTTPNGAEPAERPVSHLELLATIYRQLGIDYEAALPDFEGRPVPILPAGVEPVHELLL
jgi:hypothetical protein